MKTRYKKYRDYGLTKEEVKSTYLYLNESITPEQAEQLKDALDNNMPICISNYVADALLCRKSFDNLLLNGLDYGKSDFYGYKRKGLKIAFDLLEGWTNE